MSALQMIEGVMHSTNGFHDKEGGSYHITIKQRAQRWRRGLVSSDERHRTGREEAAVAIVEGFITCPKVQ